MDQLTKTSMKSLIRYSGVLNLLLIESKRIADRIDKGIESKTNIKIQGYVKEKDAFDLMRDQENDRQLDDDLVQMAITIGELIMDHPQMNNDLDFFKELYNRQLDKNPKRKE